MQGRDALTHQAATYGCRGGVCHRCSARAPFCHSASAESCAISDSHACAHAHAYVCTYPVHMRVKLRACIPPSWPPSSSHVGTRPPSFLGPPHSSHNCMHTPCLSPLPQLTLACCTACGTRAAAPFLGAVPQKCRPSERRPPCSCSRGSSRLHSCSYTTQWWRSRRLRGAASACLLACVCAYVCGGGGGNEGVMHHVLLLIRYVLTLAAICVCVYVCVRVDTSGVCVCVCIRVCVCMRVLEAPH